MVAVGGAIVSDLTDFMLPFSEASPPNGLLFAEPVSTLAVPVVAVVAPVDAAAERAGVG